MTTQVRSGLWYPPKLERVYGYVYTFLAGARKLANFTPITERSRTVRKETVTTHSPPAEQYREAARLCLLRDAQASIEKGGLKGLTVEGRTYNVEGFADKETGLDGGSRAGREGRCRMAHRPDGRAALQRPSREAHRPAEEVPGGCPE